MNKRFSKFIRIPLIITAIFFIWLGYPYIKDFGLTSIVEEAPVHFKDTVNFDKPILKGKKVTATFKASQSNLGILLVRFVKFGKGSDTLIFRLKREGEKKWYYENRYFGEQFKNNQYFTFGFPPIKNSKKESYVFELESLAGVKQNAIGISATKPQITFVYSYSKQELLNPGTLLPFAFKKILYVIKNVNYVHVFFVFVLSCLLLRLLKTRFLVSLKKNPKKVFKKIKSYYFLLEKKNAKFSKKANQWFISTRFYLLFFSTQKKKRIFIGFFIFLLALLYRYSTALVNQSYLFYSTLGGGGDYDQFMRASICAWNLCPLIIHQNLLVPSLILGFFNHLFGFIGGLKVYSFLMLIVSSFVATLPYFLLSRKTWFSIGGIIGSLFLATSDFLTQTALNFPPDNGSTFLFSIFFIVYLLTMHHGTIRWLVAFGLMGLFDGMFKAMFLINDLVVLALFVPVFFYEKAQKIALPFKKNVQGMFKRKNIKIFLLSLLPLFIFVILYSAWEYFVNIKFIAPYFLKLLIDTGGKNFRIETAFYSRATGETEQDLILQLFYLVISGLVMIKRMITFSGMHILLLAPIFLGLIYFSVVKIRSKTKLFFVKLGTILLFSLITISLLVSIRNNYFSIHQTFPGEYISVTWTLETYSSIFMFAVMIFLVILNFKYQAFKFSLPILPYVIMLIILTKNAPWERLLTHPIVWSVILFAFLIDWMLQKKSVLKRVLIGSALLLLFIIFHIFPKTSNMYGMLLEGLKNYRGEVSYLMWVNSKLPENAIILAGKESDLVMLGDTIERSIAYNIELSGAVLIREETLMPEIDPQKWNIISELKKKDNFEKKRYFILENDLTNWEARMAGVQDNLFSTSSATLLNSKNYKLELYKSNPEINKEIYELKLR